MTVTHALRTTRRYRPPGRGAWLRDIQRSLPQCVDVAQFIAAQQRVFVDDVPADLADQLAELDRAQFVKIAPDGFLFRAHGWRNTSSRLGGRNHDDTVND